MKLSIVLAVILCGCWNEADEDDDLEPPPPMGPDAPLPTPQTTTWEATITGLLGHVGLAGEAFVSWTEADPFTASVTLRNDEPLVLRPWHVHFGSCATGGEVVGDPAAYAPLAVDAAGVATSNAQVGEQLDPAAPYHVNIHLSPDELPAVIACGDLIRSSP